MKTPHYINDRFRRCPIFSDWDEATRRFINDNLVTPGLRDVMNDLANEVSDEFRRCAWIAGPRGQLP